MAVDRISTLPDEILCHILYFLPTRTAATTSILSKRWKPVWLSVPTLDFHDRSFINGRKPYHYFTRSIYATLVIRDVPIRTFRLRASKTELSEFDLQTWVSAAIQRGLKKLYIRLTGRVSLPLPSLRSRIFCCKTLVVLRLVGLKVDQLSFVDLPSLKTLGLDNVMLPEPKSLVDLLAGTQILEYMYLSGIDFDDDDYDIPFNEEFGSLSKLVRAVIDDSCFFDCFLNLFEGPLGIDDEDLDDSCVAAPASPIFPNLTHVELRWGCDTSWHLVFQMLKQCPMLQKFVLDMETSEYGEVFWISPSVVPECLSSQLRECSITDYGGTESELHFAKYIMLNSRVLRTMSICSMWSSELKVDKLELLKELSSCPRSSTICKLSFDEDE